MRMKGGPRVKIARGHGNDRCCILPTHIIQLPALCLHTCRQDLVFDWFNMHMDAESGRVATDLQT